MTKPIRIAVASGKGGTGKTTIAANMAAALARSGRRAAYLDCDVEEPNGHIFLKPEITSSDTVCARVPEVSAKLCIACGSCSKACQFKAIILLGDKPLTFPDLCHSCGACRMVCPANAITESARPIGSVEAGRADGVAFVMGRLAVGAPMSPPVIRQVRRCAPAADITIIDAPPGAACAAVAAVRGADVVLLVTEPTPFGLHDLKIAVETVGEMGLPACVAINRCDVGDDRVERFCAENSIPVVARIAHDIRIARAYSAGLLLVDSLPQMAPQFISIFEAAQEVARK